MHIRANPGHVVPCGLMDDTRGGTRYVDWGQAGGAHTCGHKKRLQGRTGNINLQGGNAT